MGTTTFRIFLFSFVYARRLHAGYVETVVCEDTECCVDCNIITVDPVHFDGICRKKRNHYETHYCSPDGLYYVHNIYESEYCDNPPTKILGSGHCYQWLSENTGEWVSYYLLCHHDILNSNQQSEEKDEDYIYLIEITVILLVFGCGIFGGHIVYKSKHMKESGELLCI